MGTPAPTFTEGVLSLYQVIDLYYRANRKLSKLFYVIQKYYIKNKTKLNELV